MKKEGANIPTRCHCTTLAATPTGRPQPTIASGAAFIVSTIMPKAATQKASARRSAGLAANSRSAGAQGDSGGMRAAAGSRQPSSTSTASTDTAADSA